MELSKIFNAGLIISNNYTDLCIPYKNTETVNKEIDLTTALNICSKLADNTPKGINNKLTIYGGSDTNVWRSLVIHIVQYANQLHKTQVILQIENNFLTDYHLEFCRTNNVFINLIYNKNEDVSYIKNILAYKPLSKVYYRINKETYKNLYDNYLKLEEFNCQNMDLDVDSFADWTDIELQVINEQLSKIVEHIKAQFIADEIPLVPEVFKRFINKIILQDYGNKTNKTIFDFISYISKSCGFCTASNVFINQDCNVFTCCLGEFNTENSFFCGKFDEETNTFEQSKDEFDLFSTIYPDILAIEKKSTDYNCVDCELNSICIGDCYSINLLKNKAGNITSKLYCDYNKYLYNLLKALIIEFDKDKNELFRDFIYGCSFKGYFIYDR